jgi:DNA-directed RNA polymerase specialized sigma subunit
MAQVHSPDPEVAMQAEDTLIRHNIKWIVKCLKGAAGAESIRYPGDLRNDLLAEARMGFLDGIRKFNLERAGKNGIKGQEKTVLGYCQIWIAKRVREFLPGERFGLNQDAALDRNKVIKARDELVAQTGKMPSSEEIAVRLEQKARKKLEAKQIAHPTPRQLSRAGALNSDRVDELLQHATSKLSLDAPTGDDGDDGPTMAQYVSTSAQDLDNGMLADELKDGIAARLDKLPNAQRRDGMRMRFGLPSSADAARHPIYNPEEVGVFMGRTRDSIAIYEEEMRQGFLGEEKVAVDDLRAPNLPVSLGQLRAMSTLPDDVRAAIATSVNLLAVARADGVHLDPRAPSAPVGCPLCDGGRTLTVNATAFACSSCDRAGDALDWMMAKRGLTLKDAALEAVLVAMALPSDAVESGTVTVTRDPVRKRRLQQLSS